MVNTQSRSTAAESLNTSEEPGLSTDTWRGSGTGAQRDVTFTDAVRLHVGSRSIFATQYPLPQPAAKRGVVDLAHHSSSPAASPPALTGHAALLRARPSCLSSCPGWARCACMVHPPARHGSPTVGSLAQSATAHPGMDRCMIGSKAWAHGRTSGPPARAALQSRTVT